MGSAQIWIWTATRVYSMYVYRSISIFFFLQPKNIGNCHFPVWLPNIQKFENSLNEGSISVERLLTGYHMIFAPERDFFQTLPKNRTMLEGTWAKISGSYYDPFSGSDAVVKISFLFYCRVGFLSLVNKQTCPF